ncbi:MAG: hypothetical protein FWB77_02725 [Treponema sp.]|nr:hypothetical protein [Treponema sp.]
MKRFLTILCLALFVTGLAAAQVRVGGTLYVSIKSVSLKSGTGFFSGAKGTLDLGDQVTVLQINGKNVEVRSVKNPSLSGWTSSGNFSAKQVVAGTSSTATAREVALAGKGLTQEVEQEYKKQQSNLNYADVDRVEAVTVNETELKKFLDEGRLKTGE